MARPVSTVLSRAPAGLAAPLVRVEVHLGSGLPAFALVGLPEAVVRESKERVRSALVTSGFEYPSMMLHPQARALLDLIEQRGLRFGNFKGVRHGDPHR
jgi:hypothetical protein